MCVYSDDIYVPLAALQFNQSDRQNAVCFPKNSEDGRQVQSQVMTDRNLSLSILWSISQNN